MNCRVCGEELPAYSGRGRPKIVCSTRCHNWRSLHGDEMPRWLSDRRCGHCSAKIESPDLRVIYCSLACRRRASTGSSVGFLRACRYCDETFSVVDGKQVYCSPRCRIRYNNRFGSSTNLRRSAKRLGALIEGRFSLLDVARRDGWACMLCFAPVDPDSRDRFGQATVDHIVPLTAGGTHTFGNVQLAHWSCNSAKRNSTDVITMSVLDRSGIRPRVIIRTSSQVERT